MKLLKYDLTISIVLFKTDIWELRKVMRLINNGKLRLKLFLIDNSPTDLLKEIAENFDVEYVFNNKNVGYGSGHNLAIKMAHNLADYHLVMNSDVDFDPAILQKALAFMKDHADVGLLSPLVRLTSGEMQHFCRLLPNPFDLFARRFIPGLLKPWFKQQLDEYILATHDYSKIMNIPNLPGCFMFMRMDALKQVGGFDENFFLYVEDIDLTRRLHQITKTIYYPEIEIVHGLARGSYKFSKLVIFHINSAIYYFNKWGWFFDKNRLKVNNVVKSEDVYIRKNDIIRSDYIYNNSPQKVVGVR